MATRLNWVGCAYSYGIERSWCNLFNVNLAHPNLQGVEGVYMIWQAAPPHNCVRVGQGVIADRLAAHRVDPQVVRWGNPSLFVSWAGVPAGSLRDGVERYLAEAYGPLVGTSWPNAVPVVVNGPNQPEPPPS